MLNLLPEHDKTAVRRTYRMRSMVVGAVMCAGAIAVSGMLLIPSWLYTQVGEASLQKQQALVEQENGRAEDAAAVFEKTEESIDLLMALDGHHDAIDLIANVLEARPASGSTIELTGFTLSAPAAGSSTLSVRGTAATRESLVAFTRTLEGMDSFSSVDLPISNLARGSAIPFLLTLTIAPPRL